jgi:DNA-directed RNA polymerase specialized sigma24 family protein
VVAPPSKPARASTVTRFPYERLSDAELQRAVAQGDERGIGAVWDRHSPLLRGVLRSGLGARANVEDMLQDVFLELVHTAGELRSGDALRPYLVALAVRRVVDELRAQPSPARHIDHVFAEAREPSAVMRALEPLLDAAALEHVPDELHAAGRARLIARTHEPRPVPRRRRSPRGQRIALACTVLALLSAAGTWSFMRVRGGREPNAQDQRSAIAPAAGSPQANTIRLAADTRPRTANESWTELVQRGAFDAVVNAATARGEQLSTSLRSDEDLSALSEAARDTDQLELAKRALLALRERFPHSPHSVAAPFLLGQLFEQTRELDSADRWYRVYLAEAAQGEFTAEALAGRMRCVEQLAGAGAVRPLALEYLERFPNGVQITLARRLAGNRATR